MSDFEIQESYMDGFVRGLYWPDQWETHGKPGGPAAFDDQEYKKRDAWLKGWEYGHHCKLNKKTVFKDPYHHMRKK